MFKNKTVLITGGTGSAGKYFTSQILKDNPKKIIIYSRDEFKQYEMNKTYNQECMRYFIGDIRDQKRLSRAMHGVDYVIHAAALKQVPACEYNPDEAIKTNVHGALNVIDSAIENGVEKVIALSTDKSVNPINLYGATKLCSDKLFVSANAISTIKGTAFSIVRYGNVSGSRGSVIPYFKELKKNGSDKLPITDTEMTRFYISLEQAYSLVKTAISTATGGEIYVSKIPSFKITDLIKAMGMDYYEIGIREGEKLHEVMILDTDNCFEYKDHYIIYPNMEWFDIVKRFKKGGKKKYEFNYSSGTNSWFLSVEELRALIEPN